MTKDEFKKGAEKSGKGDQGKQGASVTPIRPPAAATPQAPAPRGPMPPALVPKAPFGMSAIQHMPVAKSLRILPSVVPTDNGRQPLGNGALKDDE